MRRLLPTLALTAALVLASAGDAPACLERENKVSLRSVSLLAGQPGPIGLRLTLTTWSTLAAAPGQHCGWAVKLPTGVVDTVDAVTVVDAGTATPAAGLGTGWTPSAPFTAAVTALSPTLPSAAWLGFANALGAAVPDDAPVDVVLDVTLLPGATAGDLLAGLAVVPDSKRRFFTDQTDAGGMPLDVRQAFVALVELPEAADMLKCRRAVAKEAGGFVKAKATALRKCEDAKVRGKGDTLTPPFAACDVEAKTAAKIATARSKAEARIGKACGGEDKACGGDLRGETGGGLAGLPPICPDFASGGCAGAIDLLACDGIAECVTCVADGAVEQAIALYYADLVPTDPVADQARNRCQQAIGKETTKYLLAKVKVLRKCWDARLNGKHAAGCPDDTADPGVAKAARKAAEQIAKAESKKIAKICKACGGADQTCDDPVDTVNPLTPTLGGNGGAGSADADLDPAALWTRTDCPAVTVPAGPSPNRPAAACARPVVTLADLVACVDCVTEFDVDCLDPARVPDELAVVPAECNP